MPVTVQIISHPLVDAQLLVVAMLTLLNSQSLEFVRIPLTARLGPTLRVGSFQHLLLVAILTDAISMERLCVKTKRHVILLIIFVNRVNLMIHQGIQLIHTLQILRFGSSMVGVQPVKMASKQLDLHGILKLVVTVKKTMS